MTLGDFRNEIQGRSFANALRAHPLSSGYEDWNKSPTRRIGMAHELATTNGKTAMAYFGEVPWHLD